MIWLTWRQHRAVVGAFALLFLGAALYYVVDGFSLRSAFAAADLGSCVGATNDVGCAGRIRQFVAYDVGLAQYFAPLLTLAAGALGVFLGSPLVATEVEHGTHRWAWTERVSRRRWLAVKLVMVGGSVAALAAGLAAAYTWWDSSVAALTGPFTPFGSFDNSPLVLTAYALLAFGVGVAASTLVRHTVAAMGITALVFLAVHIGLTFGVLPHYLAPVTVASAASEEGPLGFDRRDWDWRSRWVDATGATVSEVEINRLTNPSLNPAATEGFAVILQRHGIHYVDLVQPYARALRFELTEAGLVLVLALGSAGVAFARLGRRPV